MPESVRLVRTRAEALANHPAAIVAGLGALLIALILVMLFPEIALWLPRIAG